MDNLLQEISQAQKYGNDRNKEFQAERTIRRFIAEPKPYLMQDLFSLTEALKKRGSPLLEYAISG